MNANRPPIPPSGPTDEALLAAAYPAHAIARDLPGFVDWSRRLYPAGLHEVGVHLIGFRPEGFLAGAYGQADIPMPPAIARMFAEG